MRADLPGREAFGIQRQHDLVDPRQAPLPLTDDLRLERARPVPRHIDLHRAVAVGHDRLRPSAVTDVARPDTGLVVLFVAEVLGHLLVQHGLQDRLGQLLEQPVRARQRQPLFLGGSDQLDGGFRLRGRLGPLLTSGLIVQCRGHHGTLLTRHNAWQVRPETPLDPHSRR